MSTRSASEPYLNKYAPEDSLIPADIHSKTPAEQYDLNFCWPVRALKSDKVELRPFVPSEHAQLFFEGVTKYPEVLRYTPGNFKSVEEVYVWLEKSVRRDPTVCCFAIYSQPMTKSNGFEPPRLPSEGPDGWPFAGFVGFLHSEPNDMSTEIGMVTIFPPFQRTHTQTHCAGLLMHYALDDVSEGGLGLRRCQWYTNSLNMASQKAALRLGFMYEGLIRSQRVTPQGKEAARAGRKGLNEECRSRDSWLASVTWYDWEDRVREHVDKLMAR